MGGSVAVESEPGRGSTFSFTAEFAVREVPAAANDARDSSLDLRGVKVLVVDDNQINRTIVREMLVAVRGDGGRSRLRNGGNRTVFATRARRASRFAC